MDMKNNLLYTAILLLLISCGPTMRISSDYEKEINIAAFKTFSWNTLNLVQERGTAPRSISALTDNRIRTAIEKELEARGLRPGNGKGDIEIHYHIVIANRTMVINEPNGIGYSPYLQSKKTDTYKYREGTLIIDMIDVKNNIMIWRGWATDIITAKVETDPGETINYAVNAIFIKSPFALQK